MNAASCLLVLLVGAGACSRSDHANATRADSTAFAGPDTSAVAATPTATTASGRPWLPTGDCITPRFSPDGSLLALAEVARADGRPSARLLLVNLAAHRVDTLMDAGAVLRTVPVVADDLDHAVWIAGDTVVFVFDSEDDECCTGLWFATAPIRFVRSGLVDIEEPMALPDSHVDLAERLPRLYPEFEASWDQAIGARTFTQSRGGVIVQFDAPEPNRGVLWLSTADHEIRTLVEAPADANQVFRFGGSIDVGGVTALVVRRGSRADLYQAGRNGARRLASWPLRGVETPRLELKHRDSTAAIVVLRTGHGHASDHNPVLLMDAAGIHPVTTATGEDQNIHAGIEEFEVAADGRTVAFTHWYNGLMDGTPARVFTIAQWCGAADCLAPSQAVVREALPAWARDVMDRTGLGWRYQLVSGRYLALGDLDGDSLPDAAVAVLERASGKLGVAVLRQAARRATVLGAGSRFAGSDNYMPLTGLAVEPCDEPGCGGRQLRIAGEMVVEDDSADVLVRWDGRAFRGRRVLPPGGQ